MGRVIEPGEIKEQTKSKRKALEADNEALLKILPGIEEFSDNEELQGEAWAGMKNQLSNHRSVIQGMVCANESIISDGNSLDAAVGSEDLIEDEINQAIEEQRGIISNCEIRITGYERDIRNYEAHQERLRKSLRDSGLSLPPYTGSSASLARIQINTCNNTISAAEEIIRMLEAKIEKIDEIEQATANLYSEAENLYDHINKGREVLKASWTGSGFSLLGNTDWKVVLDEGWEMRSLIQEISEAMRDQLGDDALTYEEFYNLSEDGKQGYLAKVIGIFFKIIPDIAVKPGFDIKIPFGLDMIMYYKVSANPGSNLDQDVQDIIDAQKKLLSSFTISIDEFEWETTANGQTGIKATKGLTDSTRAGISGGYRWSRNKLFTEIAITTSLKSGSVSSAMGVEKSINMNYGWEPVRVQEPARVPVQLPQIPVVAVGKTEESGWDKVCDIGESIGDLVAGNEGVIITATTVVAATVLVYATGGLAAPVVVPAIMPLLAR